MALRRSDGITADQTVYDRLVRDVAAIRSLDAEMRALDYRPPYEPGALLVSLDAKTHELVKAGKYHAWDCANERYHLSAVEPEETHVKLQFKGNLEMEKLAEVYKAFPGVSSAEPNRTTASDPLFALCATPDTHTWHYVFAESDAGLPKLHHFSVLGDGAVSGGETWSSKDAGAKPEWVDRFWNKNSCR